MNSEKIWDLVIKRVEMKLGMWKVKVLFKVGRFILVKLVLNGLFLYYMGIFKMLKKVMKKIIKI